MVRSRSFRLHPWRSRLVSTGSWNSLFKHGNHTKSARPRSLRKKFTKTITSIKHLVSRPWRLDRTIQDLTPTWTNQILRAKIQTTSTSTPSTFPEPNKTLFGKVQFGSEKVHYKIGYCTLYIVKFVWPQWTVRLKREFKTVLSNNSFSPIAWLRGGADLTAQTFNLSKLEL